MPRSMRPEPEPGVVPVDVGPGPMVMRPPSVAVQRTTVTPAIAMAACGMPAVAWSETMASPVPMVTKGVVPMRHAVMAMTRMAARFRRGAEGKDAEQAEQDQ